MFRNLITILLISCIGSVVFANGSLIHHELSVTVEPNKQYLKVEDEVTIPAEQYQTEFHFLLHGDLQILSSAEEVEIEKVSDKPEAEDFGMALPEFQLPEKIPYQHYVVKLNSDREVEVNFKLVYEGSIHHPIKQVGPEYARGFSETPGIIDSVGVFLASSSYWIPWFNDGMFTFNMTVSLPYGWDAVSQGKRTRHGISDHRQLVRWESPHPMEEAYLIAGPFTEYQRSAGAVTARVFLRTPDENLANKYLQTTAQYLEMYRGLLGPYPFSKFALVENFWETGYGMPSFTLLGPRVIRFPFILHSSYPHELLHNWWGNSVYVDFDSGNWCEGLTAYMADHLIKEQRGQGVEYRRSTLQKYTDYVREGNDFALTEFQSRHNAATEAVGYGKSLMMWHMLRRQVGDEQFIRSLQKFYGDNKFKRASFADIRQAFESVTGEDFELFFDQWVNRVGAPELRLSDVQVDSKQGKQHLSFALSQIQSGEAYRLNIPLAIYLKNDVQLQTVSLSQKTQTYRISFDEVPARIEVDPQFDVFRRLHYQEIPPSLSKIFGADSTLILLPSNAPEARQKAYRQLAESWVKQQSDRIHIKLDTEIERIPQDRAVWLFGWENHFRSLIEKGIEDYDASLTNDAVRFAKTSLNPRNNSFVIAIGHPNIPHSVVVWLASDVNAAWEGLVRKLPHYGKYSYLAFEGEEPSNIAKGQWETVHSPLMKIIVASKESSSNESERQLPEREPLAKLRPVFSEERMRQDINYLASEELKGRGLGSAGLDKAANYIAGQFQKAGLAPGGENNTYFQTWQEKTGPNNELIELKNVIGILPGKKEAWEGQSVVLCAHYDHLGLGWPDVHKGDRGKVHPGADDNASGVAVMLELARWLSQNVEPDRTIVFAAFTGEESGLLGSKYYVEHMQQYPAEKIMGAINLDTVGRLNHKKLLVLNSSSAREWKFIFMGSSYVTGVEAEMVTRDLDASDQVSFIDAGVPAVQIFCGPHRDYHRPGDRVNRIDAAGLVKVASFVREAVVHLAERGKPMTFKGSEPEETQPEALAGKRQVSTGTMPDFSYSGKGVRVANVSPDSPIDKAGMQKGDIIIRIGEHRVSDLREYSNALKTFQPGDEVTIVYLRDNQERSAKIKLAAR